MADKPLELTVTVTAKRGYDSVASHTLTVPFIGVKPKDIGGHVEKTVENIRREVTTFATIVESESKVDTTD